MKRSDYTDGRAWYLALDGRDRMDLDDLLWSGMSEADWPTSSRGSCPLGRSVAASTLPPMR